MKKQILLIATLAGALFLGSCVDDKESASVTAVREAKAEQLKAIAAHENAVAQAIALMAEKEAAIKEAEAALKAAQAAIAQAQSEVEKAKAAAEVAYWQARLEQIAVEMEAALLQAKTDLLTAQADYEKAVANANESKRLLLDQLYAAYKNASEALLTAKQNLANDQITLAQLKAGLANANEAKELTIARYNRMITEQEEYIAEQKALLAIYEAQKTPEEAKQELAAAKTKLAELRQVTQKASEALDAVNVPSLYGYKYREAAQKAAWNQYSTFIDEYGNTTGVAFDDYVYLTMGTQYENGVEIPATVDSYYFVTYDEKNKPSYTKVMSGWVDKRYTKTVQLAPGVEDSQSYFLTEEMYNLSADGVKAYLALIQKNIDEREGKALKEAEKALADKKAEIDKITNKDDKETTTEIELPPLITNVNLAKAALEKAQNQMALIEANFKTMSDEAANWNAVLADYNKNIEKRADCRLALSKAQYNENTQAATVNALESVANGMVVDEYGNHITVAQAISNCESNIRFANEQIANYKNWIGNVQTGTVEQAIEALENSIAIQQEQIPVLEKKVKDTKAALDAAVATQGE